MEKIEVELKTLKKILADNEIFYQIPDYQRPYSWDKDNLSELIDDLTFAYTNNTDEDYFCGSLVLVDNERFDIIDGQQRVTTFTILSCVFRELYKDLLERKALDYIEDSIQDKYDNNKRKLRFLTGENYQIDFEQTILKGISFKERVNFDREFANNRYLQNAHYLKQLLIEKIAEKSIDPNKLVIWIFEKIVLTVITTKNLDNAIRIFNVLNDRGMPLSPIDILKSSLMSKLSQEDRRAFKLKWELVNQRIDSTEMFNLEDMLNTYLYFKLGSNPSARVDKELLAIFYQDKTDPLTAISEIDKFSEAYLSAIDVEDKYVYLLRYLQHRIYWHSILSTAIFLNYSEISELRKILVSYYYQNWLAGATVARIKQTSYNILRAIKSNKTSQEIKEICKKNLAEYGTKAFFEAECAGNYIYGKKWDKALLLLIEYFCQDDSKINFITLSPRIHIEHILPQNSDNENAHWNELFSAEQRVALTNSLGNLTLLSMRKNIQAQNYSFTEKKQAYQNKDNMITAFAMTQEILKYEDWTPESIADRSIKMNKIIDKVIRNIV